MYIPEFQHFIVTSYLLTTWPLEGGERGEHELKEYLLMLLLGLYHRAMYSLGL